MLCHRRMVVFLKNWGRRACLGWYFGVGSNGSHDAVCERPSCWFIRTDSVILFVSLGGNECPSIHIHLQWCYEGSANDSVCWRWWMISLRWCDGLLNYGILLRKLRELSNIERIIRCLYLFFAVYIPVKGGCCYRHIELLHKVSQPLQSCRNDENDI